MGGTGTRKKLIDMGDLVMIELWETVMGEDILDVVKSQRKHARRMAAGSKILEDTNNVVGGVYWLNVNRQKIGMLELRAPLGNASS